MFSLTTVLTTYFIWFVWQCTRSESLFPLMLVCWYWIACLHLLGGRNFYRLVLINSDCFRVESIQRPEWKLKKNLLQQKGVTWRRWFNTDQARFREGGSEKVSGFENLALLILFFSGEPELRGARDNLSSVVGPVVRTYCNVVVASEHPVPWREKWREKEEVPGGDFQVDDDVCVTKCRHHKRRSWRPVRGALWSRVASIRKSTWVWCAACLAQEVYGA